MSRAEDELEKLRAVRNAALADFTARFDAAKSLAKPEELKRRLSYDAEQTARKWMWQAIEIAGDNRGVVAGTVSALLMWAGRKQILAGAMALGRRIDRKRTKDSALNALRQAQTKATQLARRAKALGKAAMASLPRSDR
ncbi:MAG TPA: hypothetical protein VN222_15700 [Novosphingobium sp.]|nr:hypothetical protein [Novosphingobium sp.]